MFSCEFKLGKMVSKENSKEVGFLISRPFQPGLEGGETPGELTAALAAFAASAVGTLPGPTFRKGWGVICSAFSFLRLVHGLQARQEVSSLFPLSV